MKIVAWISVALAGVDTVFAGVRMHPPRTLPPVILVHGIHSSSRDLTRLARHLEREGREVFLIDFTHSDGRIALDELAQELARFIEARVPAGPFDLVGFSMGGLISRYYVQRLAGAGRVAHFVTLAAPHQGTALAGLNRLPGVLQMRRGSEFLRELERDREALAQIKFTSFYTPLDLMILPARSSELPQARNVRIWALVHPSLILEKRCLRAISAALDE